MMNKSRSKFIAWLLTLVMFFNLFPMTAMADSTVNSNPLNIDLKIPYDKSGNDYYVIIARIQMADGTYHYAPIQRFWNGQTSLTDQQAPQIWEVNQALPNNQKIADYYKVPGNYSITKTSPYDDIIVLDYSLPTITCNVKYKYQPAGQYNSITIPGYANKSFTGLMGGTVNPVIEIPGYEYVSGGNPVVLNNPYNPPSLELIYKKVNDDGSNALPTAAQTFTLRFAVDSSYNYLGSNDIPLLVNGQDSITVTGQSPAEYYGWLGNNYKPMLAHDGLTSDNISKNGVEGYTWSNNTLTVYFKPIFVTFTVHYRRFYTSGGTDKVTNLNNKDNGSDHFTYAYTGSEKDVLKFGDKPVITVLSFNIPEEWVDIDPDHFHYYSYATDQNATIDTVKANAHVWPIYADVSRLSSNFDLMLYYEEGEYHSDNHTELVTLTAASGSKTYDGKPLMDSTVTATGLPKDYTFEATASGSQTEAGSSQNVVNDGYVIKDASGKDVTSAFTNVQKAPGTLTVTPAPVTLTANSGTETYDGSEKTISGYTCSIPNLTFTGVSASGKGTKVGEYAVNFAGVTVNTTKDSTGNYVVTKVEPGKLTINNATVTIKYILDSGSDVPKGYALPADATAHPGETVTLAGKPSVAGYTFDGWRYNGLKDSITIPLYGVKDGDVFNVVGRFAEKQITIKYQIENNDLTRGHFIGGEGAQVTAKVVSEVNKLLNGSIVEGQTTNNTEYEFSHWTMIIGDKEYTDFGNSSAKDPHILPKPEDDPSVTDGLFTDRTYIAHFKEVTKLKVTYSYTGTVPKDAPVVPAVQEYRSGDSVNIASAPELDHYTFSGWKINEQPAADFTIGTEDVTVTGSWTANSNTVTYQYTGNVPAGADAVPEEKTYEYGASVTIADAPKAVEGYTFEGWSRSESFSMPDEAVTITGNWKINSNTVTYQYTGNIPAGADAVPEEKTYEYGASVTIADAPKAVEGYTFEGWSRSESFSMPDEAVTITGNWKINQYRYTIHHYLKDTQTSVKADQSDTVNYGTIVDVVLAEKYLDKDLAVNAVEPVQQSITVGTGDNTITIFYTLPLEISAKTKSSEYNGKPLEGEYTITGALTGDEETIRNIIGKAPSITNVVESPKDYQAVDANNKIPSYYVTTFKAGKLTIDPAPVKLTANSDKTLVYNGKEQTVSGYTCNVNDLTFAEMVTASRTETNAGTYAVNFTGVKVNETRDTTENYVVTEVVPGEMVIAQSKTGLTATGETKSQIYNGQALIATGGGNADDSSTVTVKYSTKNADGSWSDWSNTIPSIIDAGSLTYKVQASNANYETAESGEYTLTVEKVEVTITVDDVSKIAGETAELGTATMEATKGAIVGDELKDIDLTVVRTANEEAADLYEDDLTIRQTAEELNTAYPNYSFTIIPGDYLIKANEILYNYISFDDGATYISLNPGTIVAERTAAWYTEAGKQPAEGEYEVTDYDLSGLSWYRIVQGETKPYNPAKISYVNQSVAKPNQTYYTVNTVSVAAEADGAAFLTGEIDPATKAYSNVTGPVFKRYYIATLPGFAMVSQPLMTCVSVGNTFYGVEWRDDFDAVDSRLIPFSHDLTEDEYTPINHYDFSKVVLESNGLKYYNVNSAEYTANQNLPYYTTEFVHIRKTLNTRAGGGAITQQAKDNWKDIHGNHVTNTATTGSVSGWDKPGTDGYPYKAGFYHRDYKATLTAREYTIKYVYETANGRNATKSQKFRVTTPAAAVAEAAPAVPDIVKDDITRTFIGWDYEWEDVTRDWTYTARFETTEATYTVHHYLEGTTVKVAEDTKGGKAAVGQPIRLAASSELLDGYANAAADLTGDRGTAVITAAPGANEFNVYYKVPLTVTSENAWKVYDGKPLTKNEFTVTGLVNGDTRDKISVQITGSITNVRETAEHNNTIESVTAPAYYNVTQVNGSLAITPADLEISVIDQNYTYNGAAQGENRETSTYTTALDRKVTVKGLQGNDRLTGITLDGNAIEAGIYAAKIILTGTAVGNVQGDATDNYTILSEAGKLTIAPKAITITAASDEKVYDGKALEKKIVTDGYRTELAEGDTLNSVTVTGSQTVAGESGNTPTAAKILNAKNEDVTASYAITYANGTLKVTQKPINLTAASDEKVYDGKALEKKALTEECQKDLAEGDSVDTFTVTGSRVNAGETDNIPSAAMITNSKGEDVTGSYTITYANGALEVTPKAVTITAKSEEFTYDGNAHSNAGYDVDGLVGEDAISAVVTGSITFPSESPVTNELTSYEFTAGTPGNYSVKTENGELTMKNAEVAITISAASQSWTYDGNAHSNNAVTVTAGKLLAGDELVATATGSVTNVADTATGNNPIAAGYKIMHGEEDVTANYTITAVAGTLTVNPKAVTVTAASEQFTYDGNAHSNAGYDVNGLVGEDAISAVVTGSITFPSESPVTNTLTSYEFTIGTPGNYSVTTANGELTMTNAEVAITITAASQSWTYDGNAHSNNAVTVTAGKLLTGDELVATATGSVTNVVDTADGNNPIAEGYKIMHGEEDVTANYTITAVAGTLTVNPKAVTVTAKSEEFIYDGNAHSNAGYDVDGLVGEDAISAVVTGSITFPSESPVTNELTSYEFTAGTPGNYSVTTANGELTMTNAEVAITITAASQSWTYDGAAHTNNTVTVTAGELLTGDELVATATGSVTNVADTVTGNNPIAAGYRIMHGTEDVTASYAITTEAGTLGIIPRTVTIKTEDKTKVYDNDPTTDPALTATVTGTVEGETIHYTLSREEGQDAGNYPITVTAGENPNYTVMVEDGNFSITQVPEVVVRIRAHGGHFTYDAANHTVSGYDVEIDNPLYTADDFVFSGNASVSAVNAGTTGMGLTAADFTNINNNFATVVFEVTNEDLVIDPKPVTITVNDRTKTYGDADPALTAAVDGAEGTDMVIPMLTREAGENTGTYRIGAAVAANPNYIFTILPGTLTIEPRNVTVNAQDKAKVYGSEDPELTATVIGLVNGEGADLITYALARAAGENAGDYAITAAGEAVQGNYIVNYVPATLTIVPEDTVVVTITANNGTFQYDGTAHDLSGYTVTISNPLYTEADFSFSGSSALAGTDAGTYATNMTADDFTNNNPNFGNVVFSVENGTLNITRRQVTLTSADDRKVYDGTALRNGTVTVGGDGFAENEGIVANVTGSITNPGTAQNAFTWLAAEGTNAGNYDITTVFGTLTVTEAPADTLHTLTITYIREDEVTGTFEKQYPAGQQYEIVTPQVPGYRPSLETVSGVMGNADLHVTVVYDPILYTLTVYYPAAGEDFYPAEPVIQRLRAGDSYHVESPAAEGYTPAVDVVAGTMPAGDREIMVPMIGEGTRRILGTDQPTIIIEDDLTPLGIGNAALGSGEIIE